MSTVAIPPALPEGNVLFATKTAAEAFFGNFVIPEATPSTGGVVKVAAAMTYTNFTGFTTSNFVVFPVDGEDIEVPTKDTVDELQTKLLAVTTGLNTLIERLRNAGLLDS